MIVVLLLLMLCGPADAHGLDAAALAGSTWSFDPWVVTPLYLTALLYLFGTHRLWRRAGFGHGLHLWQVACFWSGWTCLALALLSPLHWLGERLFAAHMIEHTILMAVAAPLIAVSRPVGAVLWALPAAARKEFGRMVQRPPLAPIWLFLREPLTATALQTIALWAWHIPLLYQLALEDPLAHRFQHLSFLLSASLFWWTLFYGGVRKQGYGVSLFCLFFTAMHSGVLGALITVSRRAWVPTQSDFAGVFGLTPLEDQQLAGLVMWVPMGFVYTAAALFFAAQWIASSSRQETALPAVADA